MANLDTILFIISILFYLISCSYFYLSQKFERIEVRVGVFLMALFLKFIAENIFPEEYMVFTVFFALPIIIFSKDMSLLQKAMTSLCMFSICSFQYLLFFKMLSVSQLICVQITGSILALGFLLQYSKTISSERKLLLLYMVLLFLSIELSFLCSLNLH